MAELDTAERIHQLVFRWQGNNHGRQGTGLAPVAHSCGRERAEELLRELGPLLWVEGGSPRHSLVRTVLATGEVALIQRWPTHDQNGRPSTASHVLVGGAREALKMRRCLALAEWGWSSPSFAETASGQLPPVPRSSLFADEQQRMQAMQTAVPQVEDQLVTVVAEWLRDPLPRISLLVSELPGWPERNLSPLLLLGLFGVFGNWLGRPWTFATYDVTDTHPLRLMCLPEWQPASGQPSPLVRVRPSAPTPDLAHRLAAELVRRHLAEPGLPAGRPELRAGLPGGAGPGPDPQERLRALDAILRRSAGPAAEPPTPPGRPPRPQPSDPDRWPGAVVDHGPVPARPPVPAEVAASGQAPASNPLRPPRPDREPGPREADDPGLGTGTAARESASGRVHREDPAGRRGAPAPGARQLHGDLLALTRSTPFDATRQLSLKLAELADEELLEELREPRLPYLSQRLLLDELGREHRIRARAGHLASELCAEVLDNGLYFAPTAEDHRTVSEPEQARWSARLFSWAVAPLARHPDHQQALAEVLHLMARQRRPAAAPLLYESILRAPGEVVPDLPPDLWQLLIRDLTDRQQPQPSPADESSTGTDGGRGPGPKVDWGAAITIGVPAFLALAVVALLLILVAQF